MKGDFTRITFRPDRHYSGVLLQQGRVTLDADFNEHNEIERARMRQLARDLVGRCGGPRDGAGFEVRVDGAGRLTVGVGRYYIDGLLVENEAVAIIEVDAPPGRYLAYLDAWEREVGAVEDPHLRDPALGGPDTSIRIQVVWQIRLSEAGQQAPHEPLPPCLDVRTADGYLGSENRLYRVEIHAADEAGAATFKWSRDNASLVLPLESVERDALTLGAVDGLEPGHWLEVTDEATELGGGGGQLAQVVEVGREKSTVRVAEEVKPLAERGKVRRWHGVGSIADPAGKWLALEEGIEVLFGGAGYQPGDYWTVPARPSTGGVEWLGGAQSAQRVEHHRCALALMRHSAKGNWRVLEDRRRLFAPLAR